MELKSASYIVYRCCKDSGLNECPVSLAVVVQDKHQVLSVCSFRALSIPVDLEDRPARSKTKVLTRAATRSRLE
jgi:hypothetical protein